MDQEQHDFPPGAMHARGMSGGFGKFDHEVKTHLDEHTFNLWLRIAASKEVTGSELLRDLIYLCVHGNTPAELVGKDRRELLRGEGMNGARDRIGSRA